MARDRSGYVLTGVGLVLLLVACSEGGSGPRPCDSVTCDAVALCDDRTGTAVCACPAGYDDTNGDGTQCDPTGPCATAVCDPVATCTESASDFTCTCPTGYDDPNADGSSCVDIDECTAGTANCDPTAACVNVAGSFACVCPAGRNDVVGDGTSCADIDECSAGTDNCDQVAVCTNTDGGFACACPAGYTDDNGDGTVCSNVDECAAGTDNCHPMATCADDSPGFSCTCLPGYDDFLSDGTDCRDFDECALGTTNCDTVAICTNTDGAFTCACPVGYTDDNGDGTFCSNIDECAAGTDDCDPMATCADATPGFGCTCLVGYTDVDGDGTNCRDIDECAAGTSTCDPAASCTNNEGGYDCACPGGYTDDNGDGTQCTNIDECTAGTDNCDPMATCADTTPGFACTCLTGYADINGDGTNCRDIDECAAGTSNCDASATCTNTDGGHTCACSTDYIDINGDGTVCTFMFQWCDDFGGGDAFCAGIDSSLTCSLVSSTCAVDCAAGACPTGQSCYPPDASCALNGTFQGSACRSTPFDECDADLLGQTDLDLTCVAGSCEVDCTRSGQTICSLYSVAVGLSPNKFGCYPTGTVSFCARNSACSTDAQCDSNYACDPSTGLCLPFKPVHVVVTNDLHGHVGGLGPASSPTAGGFAELSTLVQQSQQRGANQNAVVLTLDGGDVAVGTLYGALQSLAEFDYLSYSGYDAVALGETELSWGPVGLAANFANNTGASAVLQAISGCTLGVDCPPPVPVLSSNIVFDALDPGDDALETLYDATGAAPASVQPFRSFVVLAKGAYKVGIFGLMGNDAATKMPTPPLTFSDRVVAAQNMVTLLRGAPHNADIVVALSHSESSAFPVQTEDEVLAAAVSGLAAR